MVKTFLFLASVFLVTTGETCKDKKNKLPEGCLRGKLEIKGGCMNYTISIKNGNYDTSQVVKSWTDENTNKNYSNVFALGSRCNFPTSINEGDEFFFMIDSGDTKQDCAVCMMYYPTPPKSLKIKVLEKCE